MAPDFELDVTVTYLFRNRTDTDLSIEMGFPIAWDIAQFNEADDCLERKTHRAVSGFAVTVDGTVSEVQHRQGRPTIRSTNCLKENYEQMEARWAREEREAKRTPWYNEFWVWPVRFAPRGEHTIVNRYHYDARARSRVGTLNEFKYVLKTGALWRGPIERLSIRVRFGDRAFVGSPITYFDELSELDPWEGNFDRDPFRFASDLSRVTPRGAKVQRLADGTTEMVWELRDYKPTEDISFEYMTAFWARRVVRGAIANPKLGKMSRILSREGLLEDEPQAIANLKLAKLSRPQLERARDTLQALYGRVFSEPKVQQRFARKSWYLPDPEGWSRSAAGDMLLQALEERLRGSN